MKTVAAFLSTEVSAVYPICHVRFYFYYDIDQHIFRHIDFMSLLFPVSTAMMLGFQASQKTSCDFCCCFFSSGIPTQNQQETHSTLNKQPNKQLSKKRVMALLSPKQQSKTKVSSATSQMTSSPRSPCAASSQAFSVKRFGDVHGRDKRENLLGPRDSKLIGRAE